MVSHNKFGSFLLASHFLPESLAAVISWQLSWNSQTFQDLGQIYFSKHSRCEKRHASFPKFCFSPNIPGVKKGMQVPQISISPKHSRCGKRHASWVIWVQFQQSDINVICFIWSLKHQGIKLQFAKTVCKRFCLSFMNCITYFISSIPLTAQNSSKEIFPSPSVSAWMMVLSTICCSCVSFRLFPTIIFSTWNSSPLEM